MDAGRAEIINMALLYCDQDSILDPDGESRNAKLISQFYDITLQEVLSAHPWSFAMGVAQLQILSTPPKDIRFKNAFQLPTNFGRMHDVLSQDFYLPRYDNVIAEEFRLAFGDGANSIAVPEYAIHGKEIYSNHSQLQISYSRTDITSVEMTPLFRNLFAITLAIKLYSKVTGGLDGLDALIKQANLIRMEARRTDSEQADTTPENRPNLLLWARRY